MKSKLKLAFFWLLLLCIAFGAIEITLRKIGYAPGDLKPKWLNFKQVDSLYEVHDFYQNPEGILIADSSFYVPQGIHINEDGFRSPDFDKLDTSKKKILIIGDSFAWGMAADPIPNNCFADLLRNETNYEVINLGIPAADPAQYYALAKKYIPRFKPYRVFVIFFMGNDVMQVDRPITPGQPFVYFTNAGAMFADIDGKHFSSAKAAYNYVLNEKYFLRHPGNMFERLIAKSALLSRLYSLRFRIQEKLAFENAAKETGITKKYLSGIKQLGQEYNAPVNFVLIPEIKDAGIKPEDYKQKYAALLLDPAFKDLWIVPPYEVADYRPYPDGHLNNAGHRVYATAIEDFLKKN